MRADGGAVIVVGVLAQVVVWRLVARDRLPFWPAVATMFAVLGIGSLLAGDPGCCRETTPATASAVGVASGVVLFGATRVVVDMRDADTDVIEASRWSTVYRRDEEVSTLAVSIAHAHVIAVPGEELFWRGLVLPELQDATSSHDGRAPDMGRGRRRDRGMGKHATARRRGRGRRALDGVGDVERRLVAPLVSHLVWTGLMLAWPPLAGRAKVTS